MPQTPHKFELKLEIDLNHQTKSESEIQIIA